MHSGVGKSRTVIQVIGSRYGTVFERVTGFRHDPHNHLNTVRQSVISHFHIFGVNMVFRPGPRHRGRIIIVHIEKILAL